LPSPVRRATIVSIRCRPPTTGDGWIFRGHSSVGRALAWHARGREFESHWLHCGNPLLHKHLLFLQERCRFSSFDWQVCVGPRPAVSFLSLSPRRPASRPDSKPPQNRGSRISFGNSRRAGMSAHHLPPPGVSSVTRHSGVPSSTSPVRASPQSRWPREIPRPPPWR
jgi:hypothetical protein